MSHSTVDRRRHLLCHHRPSGQYEDIDRLVEIDDTERLHLGEVWLMSSMERWRPTDTPQASRYLSVDPQSHGRLRILRIGDVELHLDGHRLLVRGKRVHLQTTSS